MASDQHVAVFDLDDDDDDDSSSSSSQSHDDDDDDDDDDDIMVENDDVEDDEEDIISVSPSTSSPAVTVPIAVPSASLVTVAVPNGVNNPPVSAAPDLNRQRFETTTLVLHQPEDLKPHPPPYPTSHPPPPPQQQQIDDSRRLFQRLWTDEDEIELLQGFLDYTTQRGTNPHDTAMFYDQIKSKLQLEFNKNQLVEKLRRLKKKYRNVIAKLSSGKEFNFKSPHDQATYEISRKIWSSTGKLCGEDGNFDDEDGPSNPNPNQPNFMEGEVRIEDPKSTPRPRKRPRPRPSPAAAVKLDDKRLPSEANFPITDNNNTTDAVPNTNPNISNLIEETIKSCLSPLLKELLNSAVAGGASSSRGIGGLAMNAMPLSFGGGEMMADEKWRKQQILELEVYSKRLELVQEQVKAQLEELRSMGG